MYTVLKDTPLNELLTKPVLFDANIFMVGIEDRISNPNCSFENITNLFILPLLESFECVYIHEQVYKELDSQARAFVDLYIGKNVHLVNDEELLGKDPKYTTIFNNIAKHELVNYVMGSSKDRGEVYSMAYAAYHGINYFCSREIMVELVADELEDLKDVSIITLDIIILVAVCYYAKKNDTTFNQAFKSVYKRYCRDVIKRHHLPTTLSEYIKESNEYL